MTMEANQKVELDVVIDALDVLLRAETDALRKLDHQALDALTEEKVALVERLSEVDRTNVGKETLARLAKVREHGFKNQLLLVNARELVRGVLQLSALARPGHGGALLEIRG
jgi:flagellar biosynthesis/type III secretory pathway chaperone